jgi:predicted GNAT family acetyltransferase
MRSLCTWDWCLGAIPWVDDVRIRAANVRDYPAFLRLFSRLDPVVGPPGREEFQELAPRLLVAESPGELLGMLAVRRRPGSARISMLAVSRWAEGRGLARRMMLTLASQLRAEGIASWGLLVKRGNVRALRLYRGLGMRERSRGWCWHAERSSLALLPSEAPGSPRPLVQAELRKVERAFGIAGQLQRHLRHDARILVLEHGRRPVGVAALRSDGPYIFVQAARIEALRPLLRDLWPDEPALPIFSNTPSVGEALVAAGAQLLMETAEMEGPVPDRRSIDSNGVAFRQLHGSP